MSRKVNEAIAAKHIGMSIAFLRAGRSRGVLGNQTPPPPHYLIGRSVRYDLAELDAWIATCRVDPSRGHGVQQTAA
jgi:hypothetical protein